MPVDNGAYGNHRGIVTLQYRHIVEGIRALLKRLTIGLHLNHLACLYLVVALHQRVNTALYIAGIDICQKSQPAHVDAHQGDAAVAHTGCCAQKGAVASHRDGKVGIEAVIVKHLHMLYQQVQRVGEKGVIFPVYRHRSTVAVECGQQIADRCRLLGLVGVAENGKAGGVVVHKKGTYGTF